MHRCLSMTIVTLLACTVGCEKPAPPSKPTTAPAPHSADTPAAPDGAADADVVRPFNGKDLSGWSFDDLAQPNNWVVGKAIVDPDKTIHLKVEPGGDAMINPQGLTQNIYTNQKFGDHRVVLEVLLPTGSNSGIYVHGEYEVQVLDAIPLDTKNPSDMDHGAIARVAAPKVFTQKKLGEWQTYDITFRAPRFDAAGKKIENARFVRVLLNGQLVHENVEPTESTLGCLTGDEHPTAPLMLQGNEGPVAYRNIRITPLQLD